MVSAQQMLAEKVNNLYFYWKQEVTSEKKISWKSIEQLVIEIHT